LLDDPFSALDPERRRRLASGLGARGQVLIAVPDEAQIPPGSTVWCAEEGGIVPR
jgi:recombinational DNA repair ATPase RecF